MKKYKGIIFDSAGLGEASKYNKTTYKLNNFKEILDIVQLGVIIAVKQPKIKYETYVNLLTGKGMCNTKHTLSVFYSLT